MNYLGSLLELSALLPGVVLGCLPVRSHLRSPRLKWLLPLLALALALCLGLTACGDTESDDTQSGYETVMDKSEAKRS